MDTSEYVEMNSTKNAESKVIGRTNKSIDIEPTAEESETLEHISDRIPLSAWLIVVCELCERFAFYGLSGPFQNYIQFPEAKGNNTQP
ncbi:unnamed protein product, partial [Adineta steineri]